MKQMDMLLDVAAQAVTAPPVVAAAGRRAWDADTVARAGAVQLQALDPVRKIWISANAGTGKTEVLTRRLLTLLIADPTCPPKAILALTFTKAGAAEMAARLPRKLAELAALPDAELAAWLRENLALSGDTGQLARVRTLGAEVAAEPPMIRTIHGFAQDLLSRFSDEAGVPPGFGVLEEHQAQRLLQEALGVTLAQADTTVTQALDLLVGELGEYGWRDLTALTLRHWARLRDLIEHSADGGDLDDGVAQLRARMKVGLDLADHDSLPPLPQPVAEDVALLRDIVRLEPEHDASAVLAALDRGGTEDEIAAAWLAMLLRKDGKPRSKLVKVAIQKALPQAAAQLERAQDAVQAQLGLRDAWQTLRMTHALLVWGAAVERAYAQLKHNQGMLDYQDLLDAAERLLGGGRGDEGAGWREWVLYKLDRRFRHLLVDEAQDNNLQQARMVRVLAEEFLHAQASDGQVRTVMAVGDVKQSIYRFQGGRPEFFLDLREGLERMGGVRVLDMTHSFRTTQVVLDLVDAVFSEPALSAMVQGERRDWPTHTSVFGDQGGVLRVLPLTPREPAEEPAPWTLPMDRPVVDGTAVRHARELAARVVATLDSGMVLHSTGGAVRPEDILVLTRSNKAAAQVMQALRQAGLPVSGGTMTAETPAIGDLLALLHVLHNPADRLHLAIVLKSPLGGWTDAQLWALQELGPDWWLGLGQLDAALAAQLDALVHDAALMCPAALVGRVLRVFDIPQRYGRNTVEVNDLQAALDALHLLAADHDTLTSLLERVDAKLELAGSAAAGGIRVMTVHRSKGLEAPLVILTDTTGAMDDLGQDKLVWLERDGRVGGVLYRLSGARKTMLQLGAEQAEQDRLRADSLRLLYVALTRAKEQVWVAGWQGHRTPDTCWYALVQAGLARMDGVVTDDSTGESVLVRGADAVAWRPARTVAPVVPIAAARQAPVRWPDTEIRQDEVGDYGLGLQIHSLLMAPATALAEMTGPQADEVRRVRAAHSQLFGPGSHGEVELVLSDGRIGRMDRLVLDPVTRTALIVDFKSERRPPRTMPDGYAQQLRRYQAALAQALPDHTLRAGVLWTAEARLQWLD